MTIMTGEPRVSCDGDLDRIRRRKSVVGRATLIFEAFDDERTTVSLSDLAARVDLPKSTVHRLAEQLVELGWLERRSKGYSVGLRLFELGALTDSRNRLSKHAAPFLQDLALATGQAVHLAILDRHEVVYLETIPCRETDIPTRQGCRKPAYCTALGKAMLAFGAETDVAAIIDKGLRPMTPFTITSPELLRAELAKTRKFGVALDGGEAHPRIGCVAAPLRGSGRAIGAISIAGAIDRFDFNRMEPAVQQTAARIWATMFA